MDCCQAYEHLMMSTESQARQKPIYLATQEEQFLLWMRMCYMFQCGCLRGDARNITEPRQQLHAQTEKAYPFRRICFSFPPSRKFRKWSFSAPLLSNMRWSLHVGRLRKCYFSESIFTSTQLFKGTV